MTFIKMAVAIIRKATYVKVHVQKLPICAIIFILKKIVLHPNTCYFCKLNLSFNALEKLYCAIFVVSIQKQKMIRSMFLWKSCQSSSSVFAFKHISFSRAATVRFLRYLNRIWDIKSSGNAQLSLLRLLLSFKSSQKAYPTFFVLLNL